MLYLIAIGSDLFLRVPHILYLSRSTWFTGDDVDKLKSLGINTVRIPVRVSMSFQFCLTVRQLGYWIVEALVNRVTEFYPRGGLSQLVDIPCTFMIKP